MNNYNRGVPARVRCALTLMPDFRTFDGCGCLPVWRLRFLRRADPGIRIFRRFSVEPPLYCARCILKFRSQMHIALSPDRMADRHSSRNGGPPTTDWPPLRLWWSDVIAARFQLRNIARGKPSLCRSSNLRTACQSRMDRSRSAQRHRYLALPHAGFLAPASQISIHSPVL
jgi:hypothetical protein